MVSALALRETDTSRRPVAIEIRAPKTAELVAAHLRRQIVKGELREGDALPSETALMEQFKVSRPTLREAFRVLESELLITVRRGARGGARVHTPNIDVAARYAGLVLQHRHTTLADVYQARSIVEPPCAALVAERRTEEQLRELWEAVERSETDVDDPNRVIRTYTDFHEMLVDFAANETLRVLSAMLRHIINPANWTRVAGDAGTPGNRRAVHRGARAHRLVVERIETRDAAGAEAIWRKHLLEAAGYVAAGADKTVLDLIG